MRTRPALLFVALVLAGCARERFHQIPATDPATRRMTTSGEVVGGLGRYESHAWLGLPFAAPPVGDLRWRAPQPPARWEGTREALTFASPCVQYGNEIGAIDVPAGEVGGSEDCLALNVYAPPFAPEAVPRGSERLPVMVWIHGGGNSIGTAATFEGGLLAAHERVLVVTIQYRLGPFGWLRHTGLRATANADEASGNFGLLDQVRALEWVRDNAAAFGGDPGNVTIFGESAGAMDVYALVASPRAKGLFHRAIAQSGILPRQSPSFGEAWVGDAADAHENSSNEILAKLLVNAGRAADRAAAKALLAKVSTTDVAAFLRSRTPNELVRAYGEARGFGMLEMPLAFRDGDVLPAGETTAGLLPGASRVPMLIGTNRDELRLFLFASKSQVTWRFGVLPRMVDEPLYLAAGEHGSRAWRAASVDEPAAALVAGGVPVYAYRFDWDEEPTIAGSDLSKLVGAAHGLEVPFVFGHFELGASARRLWTAENEAGRVQLSAAMRSYWAEFARTGRPGRGREGSLVEWPAWNPAEEGGARSVIFDTATGGGVRVGDARESAESFQQALFADARLPDAKSKCGVLSVVARFFSSPPSEAYARLGGTTCADVPMRDFR